MKAWRVDAATPAAVAGAPVQGYAQPQQPQAYAPQGYAQPQQPVYPQQPAYPPQGYAQPQQPVYPPQPQGYAPAQPQQPVYAQPQPEMSNLPNVPQDTFVDEGQTDDLPF